MGKKTEALLFSNILLKGVEEEREEDVVGLLPGATDDGHQLGEVLVALEDGEEKFRGLAKFFLGQTLVAVGRLSKAGAQGPDLVLVPLEVGLDVVDPVAKLELVGIGRLKKR